MSHTTRILLVYTGGTIGMVKDYRTQALRPFDFANLLQAIPEIDQLDCEVDCVSLGTPMDSSDMGPGQWAGIARCIVAHYESHDGFVVLQGSDTMAYSASGLSFLLEHLAKPVIFTGSQLPIGDLRTDAKENLITAIQIAALRDEDGPVIREVGLYFEYKLYRGNRTTKVNAEHFRAFASPNHPPLAESGVYLKVFHEQLLAAPAPVALVPRYRLDTNVGLLKLFPGMEEGFLRAVLGASNLKALVLETFGAGNGPTAPWFVGALKEAIDQGVHIVNVTQCSGGSVAMGSYSTSEQFLAMGVWDGKDLTTEAALAKLMYLLGEGVPPNRLKTIFETPLRGEMG